MEEVAFATPRRPWQAVWHKISQPAWYAAQSSLAEYAKIFLILLCCVFLHTVGLCSLTSHWIVSILTHHLVVYWLFTPPWSCVFLQPKLTGQNRKHFLVNDKITTIFFSLLRSQIRNVLFYFLKETPILGLQFLNHGCALAILYYIIYYVIFTVILYVIWYNIL